MAGSDTTPIPQTIEAYQKLAQRDLELILEQKAEIGQLKAKINKLEQKLKKKSFSCQLCLRDIAP